MTESAADPGTAAPTANGEAPPAPSLALAEGPPPETLVGPSPPPTAIFAGEAPATPVSRNKTTQLAPADREALPPPTEPVAPVISPEGHHLTLEERVRRLEDAMAQLQDVRGIETRVAERVAVRLTRTTPTAGGGDAGGGVAGAGGEPVPIPGGVPSAAGQHRRWLFRETLAEGRAIVRMFLDPRYRLSWFTRILALALAAAILTSGFWVPLTSVPIFGTLFDKVIDLVLAFVLFKVLGHEARRYRATSPDLPPALRL